MAILSANRTCAWLTSSLCFRQLFCLIASSLLLASAQEVQLVAVNSTFAAASDVAASRATNGADLPLVVFSINDPADAPKRAGEEIGKVSGEKPEERLNVRLLQGLTAPARTAPSAPTLICSSTSQVPMGNLGCVPVATQLGDPCMISKQCQHLDSYAVCYNDICECDPIHSILGKQCSNSGEGGDPYESYTSITTTSGYSSAYTTTSPSAYSRRKRRNGDNSYGPNNDYGSSGSSSGYGRSDGGRGKYGSNSHNGITVIRPVQNHPEAEVSDGPLVCLPKRKLGDQCCDSRQCQSSIWNSKCKGSSTGGDYGYGTMFGRQPQKYKYHGAGSGDGSYTDKWGKHRNNDKDDERYGSSAYGSPYYLSSSSSTTSTTSTYGGAAYGNIVQSPQYRNMLLHRNGHGKHKGKHVSSQFLRNRGNLILYGGAADLRSGGPGRDRSKNFGPANIFRQLTNVVVNRVLLPQSSGSSSGSPHNGAHNHGQGSGDNKNSYGSGYTSATTSAPYSSSQSSAYGENQDSRGFGGAESGEYNDEYGRHSGGGSSTSSYGNNSGGVCACSEGYAANSAGTQCVKAQSKFGGSCKTSQQCGANQHCNSIGCCECDWPDYVYSDWVTAQQLHGVCNWKDDQEIGGYAYSSSYGGSYRQSSSSKSATSYGNGGAESYSGNGNDNYSNTNILYGRRRIYGGSSSIYGTSSSTTSRSTTTKTTTTTVSPYATSSASSAYGHGGYASPPEISTKWSKCYPSVGFSEKCRWHTQCSARTPGAWCGKNGTCECPNAHVFVRGANKWQAACKPLQIKLAAYKDYVVFWAKCCISGDNSTNNSSGSVQKLGMIPIIQSPTTPKDLQVVSITPSNINYELEILDSIMLVALSGYAETEAKLFNVTIASESNPYVSRVVRLIIEPEPCCTEIPQQLRTFDAVSLVNNNGGCAGTENNNSDTGIANNAASLISFKKLFKNVCGNAVSVEVTEIDGEDDEGNTLCGNNVDFLTYQSAASLAAGQSVTCVYTLTATSCNGQTSEYSFTLKVTGGDGCGGTGSGAGGVRRTKSTIDQQNGFGGEATSDRRKKTKPAALEQSEQFELTADIDDENKKRKSAKNDEKDKTKTQPTKEVKVSETETKPEKAKKQLEEQFEVIHHDGSTKVKQQNVKKEPTEEFKLIEDPNSAKHTSNENENKKPAAAQAGRNKMRRKQQKSERQNAEKHQKPDADPLMNDDDEQAKEGKHSSLSVPTNGLQPKPAKTLDNKNRAEESEVIDAIKQKPENNKDEQRPTEEGVAAAFDKDATKTVAKKEPAEKFEVIDLQKDEQKNGKKKPVEEFKVVPAVEQDTPKKMRESKEPINEFKVIQGSSGDKQSGKKVEKPASTNDDNLSTTTPSIGDDESTQKPSALEIPISTTSMSSATNGKENEADQASKVELDLKPTAVLQTTPSLNGTNNQKNTEKMKQDFKTGAEKATSDETKEDSGEEEEDAALDQEVREAVAALLSAKPSHRRHPRQNSKMH